MKRSITFATLLFLCACSDKTADPEPVTEMYFPDNGVSTWQSITPSSLGWNESAIPELEDYLSATNTRAFIVLKDGKIVIERYMGKQFDNTTNFGQNSNWYWASAGKTLTASLAGIAESKGELDLSSKTSDHLGVGWTSLSPAQESLITVRHQLTMTTGLDDAVANPDCTTKACLVFKANAGTRWAYHNAPYTLLDNVIAHATGKSLNTYLNDELKTVTGMDGTYIQTGDNNVFYSTPRSMARFGLLLLNQGKWKDTQVIPMAYFQNMTAASQNFNLSYGFLTWLNGKSSFMVPTLQTVFNGSLSPDAPADLFAAMGKNGQLINVVPSQGLVVIRMGDNPDSSLVPFTYQNELWKKLNDIIR